MKPKLLIVDDDEEIRTQMRWSLTQDYEALLASDRPSARETFRREAPSVVLLDLGLPPHPAGPEEGLALLSELLAEEPLTKVVVITGQSEKANAMRAIGAGAYDLMCKPADVQELKLVLKRCFHVAQLERDYREMQKQLAPQSFQGMLGTSPPMQAAFASIRKVATTDAPVLILGESGTGKEMAALAIHEQSARKQRPFVPINCGAIPETLLESELFGHEKGAFTGAHAQRKGHIESADGGTLFLDEIGELPPQLQVKLLRFLQEQRFTRVGGRQELQIDTRLVTATNADLTKSIENGRFREDLFYRLAVVVIKLPPLRERPGDVVLLAKAFLQRFATQHGKQLLDFSASAIRAIEEHTWAGNVRELENRIKRAVIMTDGRSVTEVDLELKAGTRTLKEVREHVERAFVLSALQRHNWKIAPTAVELDISRPTLYELMEKLGIQKPQQEKE